MGELLGALSGLGLASSAGLNAYIPALIVALAARGTDLVELPEEFAFLRSDWVLAALVILVLVETVVDKIPVFDHINDAVQTVIRPTSGAVLFAAGSEQAFGDRTWLALAVGFVAALGVHATKSASRGVINASTGGIGAPVASVTEDVIAVVGTFIALLAPILVIGMVAVFCWVLWLVVRRRTRRRRRRSTSPT